MDTTRDLPSVSEKDLRRCSSDYGPRYSMKNDGYKHRLVRLSRTADSSTRGASCHSIALNWSPTLRRTVTPLPCAELATTTPKVSPRGPDCSRPSELITAVFNRIPPVSFLDFMITHPTRLYHVECIMEGPSCHYWSTPHIVSAKYGWTLHDVDQLDHASISHSLGRPTSMRASEVGQNH